MNRFLLFLNCFLFGWMAPFSTVWGQCASPSSIVTTPSPNMATITWSAIPNAVGYELRYRVVGSRVSPTYVTASNNNLVLNGLSSNICYEFTVRTDCGNGSFSPWATVQNFCVPGANNIFCGVPNSLSSNATAQTATINWHPVTSAIGYEFRYRIIGSGATPTYVNVTTNSIGLTNLFPNTCYEYALRSQCSPHNYSPSTQVYRFCTPAASTPCLLPAAMSSRPVVNGSTLLWSTVSNAVGYEIRYRIVGSAVVPTYQYTTLDSLPLTGLQPNVCYEFAMRTHCGGNHYSPWSTAQSFCVYGGPTGFCAIPHTFTSIPSSTSTTLNWTGSPNNAVGYEIRYRLGGTYAPLSYATSNSPSVVLSGLAPNTCYDYAVRSDCGGGNQSSWSSAQSFCTTTAPACDSVRLRGLFYGFSMLEIWLDTIPMVSEYEVRWRPIDAPLYKMEQLPANEFLYIDSLLMDTCYVFSIRSHCGGGNYGPWLPDDTFCTVPCDTPGALIRTYPSQGSTLGDWWASTQINFQPYPYTYRVIYQQLRYRLANSNAPYHHTYLFDFLHGPVITDLDPNTCYEVSVRNLCGNSDSSAWSPPTYPCTDSLPLQNCDPPTAIQVFATTDTANAMSSALITWHPNANANYQTARYRILGTTPYLRSPLFQDSSGVLTNLRPNTCYEYHVNSWCAAGPGFYSTLDTFCTPSLRPTAPPNHAATSLRFQSLDNRGFTCQIFPNPTQGLCSVVFSTVLEPADYTVRVLDMLGQEVAPRQLERRAKNCTIDLSTLAQGLYLVEITAKGERQTLPLQIIP